jgi:hypothetical protein
VDVKWLHVAALFVRKETGRPIGTLQHIDRFDLLCGIDQFARTGKSPMHSPYAWIWNTGGENHLPDSLSSLGGI